MSGKPRLAARLAGLLVAAATVLVSGPKRMPNRPIVGSRLQPGPATTTLVEQLVAERAALLLRERRLADEREQAQLSRFADKDRALRTAELKAADQAKQLSRLELERQKLAAQRKQLVDRLTQRDREVAAEVAAFREAMTASADESPAKRAALQRYADGDRVGALAALDMIDQAENQARIIAHAAKRRGTALLALDAKDHGELQTSDLIQRWLELTQSDPNFVQTGFA
jgi:hypothetical protein